MKKRIGRSSRGFMLVGLVITMVILSMLGAYMLSITTSSLYSQIAGNLSAKAYYIAESGFRYAAGEFFNAGTANQKFAKLEQLSTYNGSNARNVGQTPAGKYGKFELYVTPYFLVFNGTQSGSNISLIYPGTLPPSSYRFTVGTYQFILNQTTYTVAIASGSGTSADPYICTFSPAIDSASPIPDRTSIRYRTTLPSGGSVTINKNENLTVNNATYFPMRNGVFTAKNAEYHYEYRISNTLYNITGAQDAAYGLPFTLSTSDQIVLNEYADIKSKGIVGGVTREVSYRTPMGQVALGGTSFAANTVAGDRMTSETFATNWFASSVGGHSSVTVDGGSAMQATNESPAGLTAPSGSPGWVQLLINLINLLANYGLTGYWSFIAQNFVNFTPTWLHQDNLLSYETQVKTARGTWQGSPASRYIMGISFKVAPNASGDDVDFYGLSFVRSTRSTLGDPIPNEMVPSSSLNDTPILLLWQKVGHDVSLLGGQNAMKWVAYKVLGPQVSVTNVTQTISRGDMIRISQDTSKTATVTNANVSGGNGTLTLKGTNVNVANYYTSGQTIQKRNCVTCAFSGDDCCTSCFLGFCQGSGTWGGNCASVSYYYKDPTVDNNISHIVDWATLEVRVTDKYVSTASPVVKTDGKYNLIRAYYGAPSTGGSPTGTPTDLLRYLYSRGQDPFVWPRVDTDGNLVYPWTPTSDYDLLTLAVWDGINTSLAASQRTMAAVGTDGVVASETGAVIRSNSVTTPYTGTSLTTPEIMLHTSSYENVNLFFDDFAIRFEGATSAASGLGFLPTVQQ